MSGLATGLNLAWLPLAASLGLRVAGHEQPQFVAILQTLTATECGIKSTNVHDLFRWAKRLKNALLGGIRDAKWASSR